jgi:integrase
MRLTPLQKTQRRNHPRPNSVIKSDPIRNLDDIAKIKELLKGRPRDFALFVAGINSALRGSDIVDLKVSDIEGLKPGDHMTIRIEKTERLLQVTMNKAALDALKPLIETAENDYLFPSAKTKMPITRAHLGKMVKEWCKEIGLKGRFCSHTLRKTWGYIQYFHFKTPLSVISKALGHTNETVTRAYLCIQEEHVKDAFMNVI